MSGMKTTAIIVSALLLTALGQPSLVGAQDASAKERALSAPPVSLRDDRQPAREFETYSEDIRLTNLCIDQGGSKPECVCVVSVLKYELDLGEYRAAAQADTVPARYSSSETAANTATSLRRVARASDFSRRCSAARTYFARVAG